MAKGAAALRANNVFLMVISFQRGEDCSKSFISGLNAQ